MDYGLRIVEAPITNGMVLHAPQSRLSLDVFGDDKLDYLVSSSAD
jgi:hypothetical protein